MNASQIYIAIAIVVLAVIAIIVFLVRRNRPEKKFGPLASLAFAFIIAGICFGENRILGYSLMGAGVLLAIIDIVRKSKKKEETPSGFSI
ncbi:MAG: hypothetical protein A2Y98_01875 [Candidatus Portnoybacteria bacterium RBG_19FT_COMBO_36_7]|uniref:Uncharacterized protein n=1 Tax=Candidatus Portnoybacteria bacterium RBG_19FT_COMBO_36_7 TaxID=1801992 RepID=A0A1G2F7X2_9BACT|nr:MAG: hypothetical protein A2Y98_01875 [Candidatus Portnoybacteria bacterium RBG_19FT_COMBO_36_7]